MGRIRPEHIQGDDWEEFARRFPDAARFLQLCSLSNELRKTEGNIDALRGEEPIDYYLERRSAILAALTAHARSSDRWDHRFL